MKNSKLVFIVLFSILLLGRLQAETNQVIDSLLNKIELSKNEQKKIDYFNQLEKQLNSINTN